MALDLTPQTEQKEITNYSNIKQELENAFPNSEKRELILVLNKPVVIYDFKAFPSSLAEGKEFVVILAELEENKGKRISFNCGEIVLKQLQAIREKLPVRTIITRLKGKRYYTLISEKK